MVYTLVAAKQRAFFVCFLSFVLAGKKNKNGRGHYFGTLFVITINVGCVARRVLHCLFMVYVPRRCIATGDFFSF